MNEIWNILVKYEGTGMLFLAYLVCLGFLFVREDDGANRAIFLYTPLTFVVLFFLPPFFRIYSLAEGADTYYRILWMAPMTMTIGYCVVRQFSGMMVTALVVALLLISTVGTRVYDNENILRAENRLHLPQLVLDICDRILTDSGGERTMAAMPPNVVQFVRQYDSRILMPYGREMLMPQWNQYYQSVYDAYIQDPIQPEAFVKAVREYGCEYVVLEAAKDTGEWLADYGMDYLDTVDGFVIYRDPSAGE